MVLKRSSTRKLPQNNVPEPNQPTPISIEAMVIDVPMGRCYFKRLKYRGCPTTSTGGRNTKAGEFKSLDLLVDMHRDDEIRKLYEILREQPANSTIKNCFDNLCEYVRTLDEAGRPFNFFSDNVLWYGQELVRLMKLDKSQGGISGGAAANRKATLSRILKYQGQHNLVRQLPVISVRDQISHPTLDDHSFTAIGKFLHKGYRGYMTILQSGENPVICQLFDQTILIELNKSKKIIDHEIAKAKQRASAANGDWRNSLIRIAILLTFIFTGINPTPLFSLRRCDVKFKKGAGDHYELDSVKYRAGMQKQTNELGFTRYSKDFFESWLLATEHWSHNPNALVFPRFISGGDMTSWIKAAPQTAINKVLISHGLPSVTSSIFRKTRAQMLMRVLNDVHAVADANNNSIKTTDKHYLQGVQAQHDLANSGASNALFKLAQGADKSQVIAEFEATCKDPLTKLEFLKDKHQLPSITRTGLCCWQPSADKIAKEQTKYRNINPTLDTCIDFLGCFDCPSHALVAEVDNIWMMLSFHDSLRQVLTHPAYNSTPSEKFSRTEIKTEIILGKLLAKAPKAYREAEELNRTAPHPLYDDSDSIDDLLRIYG